MKLILFLLIVVILATFAYAACNNQRCSQACIKTGSWGGACLGWECKCFHNPGS